MAAAAGEKIFGNFASSKRHHFEKELGGEKQNSKERRCRDAVKAEGCMENGAREGSVDGQDAFMTHVMVNAEDKASAEVVCSKGEDGDASLAAADVQSDDEYLDEKTGLLMSYQAASINCNNSNGEDGVEREDDATAEVECEMAGSAADEGEDKVDAMLNQ